MTAQLLIFSEKSIQCFGRRYRFARDDEGFDSLPIFAVSASNDGAMLNLGVTTERCFDFFCVYLDPACINDVVNATIDPQITIGVDVTEISASPPPFYEFLRG